MLRTSRHNQAHNRTNDQRVSRAPLRRPGAVGTTMDTVKPDTGQHLYSQQHPLVNSDENRLLYRYERTIKDAFDGIVPVLKEISALQHEKDFQDCAQAIAKTKLGYSLPEQVLDDAWVDQLNMKSLFAWCVFLTYKRYSDDFFNNDPLGKSNPGEFDEFLQSCGFHTLDITPCSDGRLAHFIRYVLRLPHRSVRRKSYAGAMFDIDNNIQKWVETEMMRYREAKPNPADAPTRYLKMVVYHFSSIDPEHEGCAAHGSDQHLAAEAGLERLMEFKQAIENSFCCGASIDLLLVGCDTATDAIRMHIPGSDGKILLEDFVDSMALYEQTQTMDEQSSRKAILDAIEQCTASAAEGMKRLCAQLLENSLSQIAYVRDAYGRHYPDIGHAERFIGVGIGFEEKQLRNLMYFAYLNTVEESVADLDVGIKIFNNLNVKHGLPIPVVVRFDYHSNVPGARERAIQRCARVTNTMMERYSELAKKGLLHVLQLVRDCTSNNTVEVVDCTVDSELARGTH